MHTAVSAAAMNCEYRPERVTTKDDSGPIPLTVAGGAIGCTNPEVKSPAPVVEYAGGACLEGTFARLAVGRGVYRPQSW